MSRKTRRNIAPEPSSPSRPAARFGKASLFAAGAAALLILFAAVALVYTTGEGHSAGETAEGRAALASVEAPSLGSPGAPVHIVEFLDPACETCAIFYGHVKRMMAANPDRVRLTVRHVAFHQGAGDAVRVLEAARAQGKYWHVLEALLANQEVWVENHRVRPERIWSAIAASTVDLERLRRDMEAPAVAARMARDMQDARTLRVTKTPEYFVNGRQMPEFGLEALQALVGDEVRRTAQMGTGVVAAR